MTSSTKPEAHKVSHYRQRITEPQPQVTYTGNWVRVQFSAGPLSRSMGQLSLACFLGR